MIGVSISRAKGLFFDRPAVMAAVNAAARRPLEIAGRNVRTTARRSIRPARQKTAAELTDIERREYERRLRRWQKQGRSGPRPKRPLAPSQPGQPPRSVTGLLRNFLFYVYDPETQSVVIGPARLNGGDGTAPSLLEFGGSARSRRYRATVRIAARPYMQPALETERPKLAALWRNAIRAR